MLGAFLVWYSLQKISIETLTEYFKNANYNYIFIRKTYKAAARSTHPGTANYGKGEKNNRLELDKFGCFRKRTGESDE